MGERTKPGKQERRLSPVGEKKAFYLERASEIAREATEDHFDCLSVLTALDLGFKYLTQGSKKSKVIEETGKTIIDGVCSYFYGAKMCYKTLLPQGENEREIKKDTSALNAAIKSISENLRALSLQRFNSRDTYVPDINLLRFIDTIPWAIHETQTSDHAYMRFTSINVCFCSEEEKRQPGYQEKKDIYAQELKVVESIVNDMFDCHLHYLDFPSKMIGILRNAHFYTVSGLPDILTDRYGGVSIQDVINEQNPESFTAKAIILLQNMPKGDFYWQRLVELLFIDVVFGDTALFDQTKDSGKTELIKKVMSFQWYVAHSFLMPALVPKSQDNQVDQQLVGVLSRQDERNMELLGLMVYNVAVLGPLNVKKWQPDIPWIEALASSPISSLATLDSQKTDPNIHFILTDHITHHFLAKKWGAIKPNLTRRLTSTKLGRTLIDQLERVCVGHTPEEMTTSALYRLLSAKTGDQFAETATVSEDLLREALETEIDPHILRKRPDTDPDVVYEYPFQERSVPSRLGIAKVLFSLSDTEGKVFFMLHAEGLSLVGNLNPKTGAFDISLDSGEKNYQLREYLKEIVYATFFDYLIWEGEIENPTDAINTIINKFDLRASYQNPDHARQAAWRIHQSRQGGLTLRQLEREGLSDLAAVLKDLPGGLIALKEQFREATGKRKRTEMLTPDQANREFADLLGLPD